MRSNEVSRLDSSSKLAKRVSSLPAKSFTQTVSPDAVFDALVVLEQVTGRTIESHRQGLIVEILVEEGFTEANLIEAVAKLKVDPAFNEKVRYNAPITAADIIEAATGVDSRTKLFSWHEMLDKVHRGMTTDQFAPVRVSGEEKPRWRLR